MTDLYVKQLDQKDRRLGRQVVHDPQSRRFAVAEPIDTATWRNKAVRVYDPIPNPNQCHGECTGVAQCVLFNAVGNRKLGQVLRMDDAHRVYSLATTLDPWPGAWVSPAWDDTGSSGLAAAKASQRLGLGGEYRWEFRGVMGVIDQVQRGRVVAVGTRWDWRMFDPDNAGIIEPGGGSAGGHEWTVRRVDVDRELAGVHCWWGVEWRDYWIRWSHLEELLADDGDAHVQDVAA